MASSLNRSDHVYKCDVCTRRTRIPVNDRGIEVVQRCIVTANCLGKMQRVTKLSDVNSTPVFPPAVAGLKEWFARTVLFTHQQPIASMTWNIPHNLENNPNVYVYVNRSSSSGAVILTLITPQNIEIIDLNNLRISFSKAESGLLQCISMSSQNVATPSITGTPTISATDMQLSNQGELTFATLDPTARISIKVTYNSPASPQPITIEYLNIDTVPSILSPWINTKFVIINGKKYYVRSVNMISSPPAPLVFGAGLIATGSTVYFADSVVAGQTLLLLSNSPYTTIDRIYDRYIDTASVNGPTSQLYYSAGNMYVPSTILKNTYPPIIVG